MTVPYPDRGYIPKQDEVDWEGAALPVADRVSKETRSRTMRAVRARDTRPEIRLRHELDNRGIAAYEVAPHDVTGSPDIAFRDYKLAVFVDGCFWHGCPEHCRLPATNRDYWIRKVERNAARDRRDETLLRNDGWFVLRLWEHELSHDLLGAADRVIAAHRHLQSQTIAGGGSAGETYLTKP